MKKKRTKRTNSQSEVESESQKQTISKKIKQSPIKIESVSKGIDMLNLQKISQEIQTIASNELESPKTVSACKKIQFEFGSNTKSIDHPQPKQLCIPMVPATFFDSIHYPLKCAQIKDLLEQGIKKQNIIPWIQDNNRLHHGIETNCQLLAEIESQQFWNVIVHEMLNDVLRFSDSLHPEKIQFLTLEDYGNKKLQIGRGYCYLILIQWFFGLIPPQGHLLKQNAHCTFASYMYKQKIDQNKQHQRNFLTNSDKERLVKLKAIISYLSLMTIQDNHVFLRDQAIFLEFNTYKMKQNFFQDPLKNEKKQSVLCQYDQDFGQIGDEVFAQISFKTLDTPPWDNKFNQGKSLEQINKTYAFFEIQGSVLNQLKFENQKNQFELNVFLLEHPQAFIVKLLFPGFTDEKTVISIRGLRKWSTCIYSKNKVLEGNQRFNLQGSSKSAKNFTRLILTKQENYEQISIKDYMYDRLKIKIQKYINLVKASIKGCKQKEIIVPFDTMNHKDIYLNFLLIWAAISQAQKSKCHFLFGITQFDKSTMYSLSKFHENFQKKDLAQLFSVVKGYELFLIEKKKFFSSPKDISFLEFIKRHAF